jgi:hypothetical protein
VLRTCQPMASRGHSTPAFFFNNQQRGCTRITDAVELKPSLQRLQDRRPILFLSSLDYDGIAIVVAQILQQQSAHEDTQTYSFMSREKYGVKIVNREGEKGDSLRACRREKFLNEESITYRDDRYRKLLILRPRNSISDRLLNCTIILRPFP